MCAGGEPAGASEPLDLRLALPALATWLGAFVGTGDPPGASAGWAIASLAAVGLPLLALTRPGRPHGRRPGGSGGAGVALPAVLLAVASLGAGLAVGGLHLAAVRGSGLTGPAAERAWVSATGRLTGDPVLRRGPVRGPRLPRDLVTVPVRLTRVQVRGRLLSTRAPVVVLAQHRRWARLLPGQEVVLTGRLGPARPGQPVAAVLNVRGPPSLLGRPPALQRVAGLLRAGLRDASAGLAPDQRGLLPGLVVGDTSQLPPDLDADMRIAGLTHLTAVSGANLAILVGFVLVAGRWAGLRGQWLSLAGAAAMAGFVILARPQPSVVRAAAMGAVGLLALATGRPRRGVAALSAAVLVLLLLDPWLARSFGFVLSAMATGALVLLAPGWARSWQRRGLPRAAAEALAVPLAAQLVTGPVVVLLSGQVSLVGVPANLAAAPAVAPATLLGVLVTAVAPLSESVAGALAVVAGLPVWWIVAVAHRAAAVPLATVGWPGTVLGSLLLATVTAAAVALVRLSGRHPAVGAGAAAVLAVAVVVPATSPGWPPRGWVLAACDVGQGEALVLFVASGTGVLVDAGPDPRAVDRCLSRLGVRRVPLVLLTHLHADHVEGLPGVLRGRQVGEVVLGGYRRPATELRRVLGWARSAGVPVTGTVVGDRVRVGPVWWRVIWPARVIDEESVANNASLVLLVRTRGLRLLLTGEAETPAQRALVWSGGVPRVDVLKVAHHGSVRQEPALVAAAAPRLALISVGVDNGYGQPADATLRLLRRAGALVGRTDRDGTLLVVRDPGRLRLLSSR